jgi:hypothetical protein
MQILNVELYFLLLLLHFLALTLYFFYVTVTGIDFIAGEIGVTSAELEQVRNLLTSLV